MYFKGQIISEGSCGAFQSPKNERIFLKNFCSNLQKLSNVEPKKKDTLS